MFFCLFVFIFATFFYVTFFFFLQGCSRMLWGVIGAAVVITLITIPAVYFSGKSDYVCAFLSVSALPVGVQRENKRKTACGTFKL